MQHRMIEADRSTQQGRDSPNGAMTRRPIRPVIGFLGSSWPADRAHLVTRTGLAGLQLCLSDRFPGAPNGCARLSSQDHGLDAASW